MTRVGGAQSTLAKVQPRVLTTVFLTVVVAALAEALLNLEWSFPYCNDQSDGPASAVFGAPFPYTRASGATSLEFETVPYLYVLNLAFWCLLAWPLVRRLVARASGRPAQIATVGGGVLLCAVVVIWNLVGCRAVWSPAQLMDEPWEAYRQLRPVGFAIGRHTECTPSTWWFGPVRRGVP